MGVHLLDGRRAGLEQPDGVGVPRRRDANGASQGDFLHDQLVGDKIGDGLEALGAREHHGAAEADEVQGLDDGFGRVGGNIHHHIGTASAGEFGDSRNGVLVLHVDGVMGPEGSGEFEFLVVGCQPCDDDIRRPRFPAGEHAAQPALAGAHDDDGVAGLGSGHLDPPAKTGAQGIEHHGEFRGQARVDLVHDAVGVEVHVFRVRSPEAGGIG